MSVKKKKLKFGRTPSTDISRCALFAEERERKKKTHTRKKIYTHI